MYKTRNLLDCHSYQVMMAQEVKIEGKNVLITGGASGLGAAYAEAFLKFGADKIAILDVQVEVGEAFATKLNETYNNKVIFIKCDVSKEEEIEKSFQEVLAAFKRIDVLINNAGIMNDSPNIWRTACDVNWQGLISFTKKGIDHMRVDEGGPGGTIVNVSSTAAIATMDVLPVYCGSKAAVLHFGRSVASPEFYSNTGIRILTICFGPTVTPLLENLPVKFFDKNTKLFVSSAKNYPYQRVDSAVEAMLKMFREGNPGSVWLSTHDKEGQDISSAWNEAYAVLKKLIQPDRT